MAIAVAILLGSAKGNAQDPSDERSWRAELTRLGGQEQGIVGEVVLRLGGQEQFFLSWTIEEGEAAMGAGPAEVTGFAFFLRPPSALPGGDQSDPALVLNCDGSLRAAQAGGTCGPTGSVQGPLTIFMDGFESGSAFTLVELLDAERVVVDVRTTEGDLSGIFGVFPSRGFVPVDIPAGLSTFGLCGASTDTDDLLLRHPALDAIFLLNPETVKFDAVHRGLPRNIRPNLPIVRGQGMFLRASEAFTMEVQAVQSAREARLSVSQMLHFEEIEWTFQAGIQLLATCGDAATNTTLLGSHDAISRVATFDASTREWTLIGKALPPALRTEVPVPTSGALVVFADANGTVLLPCETAECQSFTATDDLFLSTMAR